MSNYITTHNSQGQAIFSDQIPTAQSNLPIPGMGSLTVLSSIHNFPPDLSTDADVTQYAKDREQGFPPGRVCPENGAAVAFLTFNGDAVSPTHRTMSFDTCVVIQGKMELELDSGEKRVLRVGDSVQQRACMHLWRNITEDGGEAKLIGIGLAIKEPLEIGGVKLDGEWRG